jgi:hypothetical protein
MDLTSTESLSKSSESGSIKTPASDPPNAATQCLSRNSEKRSVIVLVRVSVEFTVCPFKGSCCNKDQRCRSDQQNDVNSFLHKPKADCSGIPAKREYIYSALFDVGHSSRLEQRETEMLSQKPGTCIFLHMGNSTCHNPKEITGKLQKRHTTGALHPVYLPDLSPCDFWVLGMVKKKTKDREFCPAQEILSSLSDASNDLALQDIQRVSLEWMNRLTWVIESNGEDFPK